LNDILFPAVVENDTAARLDRLQRIFIEGTKLSLATVVPMSGAMMLLARPLVTAWVGPDFSGSILHAHDSDHERGQARDVAL